MPIQIKGYDISHFDTDEDGINHYFGGVAHMEYHNKIADIPFQGQHQKGATGFIDFTLIDADQIEVSKIREKAGEIRDILAEHLLEKGYETGEYRDVIDITDNP